MNSLTSVV